ncbi:GAF domain-containing protein, partial [Dokdonella sp.]|uniref:GAF domain-containing protein n=1 Tax=Dokdonella sp. TaxID=2291710 RepID=UPI003C5C1C14
MKLAQKESEAARLSRLHALRVLDTEPEPLFDALVRAASLVTGAPIALVSLVDTERQWFKSNFGLEEATETPRNVAFCAHAILGEGLMEVPDARLDPRFANNPLVIGEPGIRFYGGAPIALSDGFKMGTLCVIDRQPRVLTDLQRNVLSELANAAAEALQQRKLALEKSDAQTMQVEAERAFAKEHERHANVIRATEVGTFEWNVVSGEV